MARVLVALALSDLGRDALKFVTALALAIMLALAFSVSTLMTVARRGRARATRSPSANTDEIPPSTIWW